MHTAAITPAVESPGAAQRSGPAAFEQGQLAGLYAPPRTPVIVDVPTIIFLAVDAPADPTTSLVAAEAADALLAVSAAVRTLLAGEPAPPGRPVARGMPLEILYPCADERGWTLLVAQPHTTTPDVVRRAVDLTVAGGGLATASTVVRRRIHEGWAAQVMNVGPPAASSTVDERLAAFLARHGYQPHGRRHEIRLDDPSTTPPDELRRIVRQPVVPLG